jgi:hypothetical protein
MAEKKYVGSGKKIGQYGNIAVSICLSDLDKNADIKTAKNGKKYLNVIVSERRSVGKFGETHLIYINDYKPKDDVPF